MLSAVCSGVGAAQSNHVRSEPAAAQLFPHHCGPLQFPPATTERGPRALQDDPDPGLQHVFTHHEQPAACHRQHHPSDE